MDTIKERLGRGEILLVAAVGRIVHHNLVQMIGLHGGFHAIWFDMEHMDYPTEKLEIGALACRSLGMDCFVRLAATDYAAVTRTFEAGAGGVMAAQVRSAAEAEQLVTWAKFHPRGCRGLNTAGWDARFATIPPAKFAEQSNRETFVAIQIETVEALEECDKIAAIDGVDMLFLGPADMSQNLGVIGDFLNPKCMAAIDRIAAACKQHKKPWGVVPVNPDYAAMCVEKGCRLLSVGSDVRIINQGIEGVKHAYAKFFGSS
ncbi:MAG TPA: aldolase/citrate lyase family protein [Planctomycetaceae bacterium]|nr:aldolase/citrate lyase family protein [Planctomycetaceae bacterium]